MIESSFNFKYRDDNTIYYACMVDSGYVVSWKNEHSDLIHKVDYTTEFVKKAISSGKWKVLSNV